MKYKQIVLLLLLGFQTFSLRALTEQEAENGSFSIGVLASAWIPLKIMFFDKPEDRCKLADPMTWFKSATLGLVGWLFAYGVLMSRTPQDRYRYALSIKNDIADIFSVTTKDEEIDSISILYGRTNAYPQWRVVLDGKMTFGDAAYKRLHYYYDQLNLAHQELVIARQDISENDVIFVKKCEKLSEEIKALIQEVERYVRKIIMLQVAYQESQQ